jgi:hypothetical protein
VELVILKFVRNPFEEANLFAIQNLFIIFFVSLSSPAHTTPKPLLEVSPSFERSSHS